MRNYAPVPVVRPRLRPKRVSRRVFVGAAFSLGLASTLVARTKIARAGVIGMSGGRTGVAVPNVGGDPLSLPLYNPANITYDGYFKLPTSTGAGSEGFKYAPDQGGGAISYNAAGNGGAGSLFIGGTTVGNNRHTTVVAEVSIPSPTSNGANTASLLQGFAAVCEGNDWLTGTTSAQGSMMSGLLVADDRLFMTAAGWYLTGENQPYSIGARDSLTLATSNMQGPYKVTSLAQQRIIAVGLGCEVPANWQSIFGGYTHIAGGAANVSTGNDTSSGPQVLFFNPTDLTGSNASAKPGEHAFYYAPLGAIGVFAPADGTEIVTGMSTHRGTVMLPDSRTILCYGCHGEAFYDTGGAITGENQGTYSRSLWDRFWLYDAADDVLDGFNGSISKNDGAQPYAVHDMNFCLRNNMDGDDNSGDPYVSELEQVRGGCLDPVNNRFFVVEHGSGPDFFPVVHQLTFG